MISIAELIARDGPGCHYCDAPAAVRPTREHIVPRALFGPDDPENLVIACHSCNSRRNDKIDKCWCEFCQEANARWLNAGLAMLATRRRTDEERAKIFRAIWAKRDRMHPRGPNQPPPPGG